MSFKSLSAALWTLITLAHIASAAGPYCSTGPRTIGGRSCNVTCGLDRAGGDYGQLKVNTWEGCVQACAADNKCVTAQYHYGSGFCYLKSVRNTGVVNNGEVTVDCDPSTSYTAPPCVSGSRNIGSRTCQVSCGADRPGGDYGSLHTTTFEGCIQACANDNNCVTAVYNEGNGYCYAKNRKNNLTYVSGQDTIDCVGIQ